MNSNLPSTRQWKIQIIPWLSITGIAFLFGVLIWAAFNGLLTFLWIIVLLAMLVAVALFGEYVTCELDLDRRVMTLRRIRIGKSIQREIQFANLLAVSFQESRGSTSEGALSVLYSTLFALKSGELIPLNSIGSNQKNVNRDRVQAIAGYINQVQSPPVQVALDGVVRIHREGESHGICWQMEFIANNDHSPITQWWMNEPNFPDDFVLIMPSRGVSGALSMPSGVFGSVMQMVVSNYIQLLGLNINSLPGFGKMEVLPGEKSGLGKAFMVLTSNSALAANWLTSARAGQFLAWAQANPLKMKKSEPHLLLSSRGLCLIFIGNFNQDSHIADIARLGAALTR